MVDIIAAGQTCLDGRSVKFVLCVRLEPLTATKYKLSRDHGRNVASEGLPALLRSPKFLACNLHSS